MENKKVAIIGLGLIGGSLARAFNERLGIKDITAINRSQSSIDEAVADGNIARGFKEVNEFVFEADIIFICTPVKKAIEYIEMLTPRIKPDCILTDVGSTKAEIIDYVNKMASPPCFIGGHPMAGTEKTGYKSSFSHLFENAFYILSPTKGSNDGAIELMTRLVAGINAIPVVLDSKEHDMVTGSISHVPHVIASALVNLVKATDTDDKKMQMLAAGGFKDITRIASSSPEIWENIITSNKSEVKTILEKFIKILHKFMEHIDKDDSDSIYDFFQIAKEHRDTFAESKKGLINTLNEVVVDVIDKPGIIGEIATLLGENSVNIQNINVSNSREYEQGCLRITFYDSESMNFAKELLISNGYKI